MSGCRIGNIRMKNGGAVVRRLPLQEKDDAQAGIIRGATIIANKFAKDEMAGYVVIGWGPDGAQSCGYLIRETSPFGATMAPEIVADILRRNMIEYGDWS